MKVVAVGSLDHAAVKDLDGTPCVVLVATSLDELTTAASLLYQKVTLQTVGQPTAPPVSERQGGWNTSIGSNGKAHYTRADGSLACAGRWGPHGARMGKLFTRPTRPYVDGDHLCHFCTLDVPKVCRCWACTARRKRQEFR